MLVTLETHGPSQMCRILAASVSGDVNYVKYSLLVLVIGMTELLKGKIALVAGATRGAGRAIAMALAGAGATVYVTGRSTRQNPHPKRPETIEETAEIINRSGGIAYPIRVDHRDEMAVSGLMKRISDEHSVLDILINDLWGGEAYVDWSSPLWEQDIDSGISMFNNAVMTHIITAKHAAPLLMKSRRAILVELTDGVGYHYRGNVFYSLVKISTNHLATAFAEEFHERGVDNVVSVAVTPGFLRSEEMLDTFGVRDENWRDAIRQHPDFAGSETPHYVAAAITCLSADPQNERFNGKTLSSWGLSKVYDFRDTDGTKPDWENFHELYKSGKIDPFTWKY